MKDDSRPLLCIVYTFILLIIVMLIVNGAYSKKTEIQHSLNNSNNTFYCIDFLTGWYRTALNIMRRLKKLKKVLC